MFMQQTRIHIFVTGKVQGVFFRQSLKVVARKRKTTGWVRNLQDGRVEAVVEGDEHNVANVIEWCHCGSANSRVDYVQTNIELYTGKFEKFDVLY
ncbi:MAG: acylphosphatase [Cenarchaeum symbiont of Oopsacas minuta]|nr:acylphosphatase [Cenarchaeum symbiont of Oopsacas minuta]